MGGAAGHLSHIWEDLDITFKELYEILSEASQGNLNTVEKFDGCNLYFCVDTNGVVRFARNETHIHSGGVNLRGLRDFFAGHPAQSTFVKGATAICEAVEPIRWPLGFSKRNWINCDIIDTERAQLLEYDSDAITLHECVTLDGAGNRVFSSNSVRQFNTLIDSLPESVSFGMEEFKVLGPQRIDLPNLSGSGVYTETVNAIDHCRSAVGLDAEDTLREFAYQSIFKGVTSNINISSERSENLARLIVGYDSPTLVELKKGLNKNIASKISAVGTKKVRSKIIGDAIYPIELAICRLGEALLNGVSSVLIENPMGEKDRIYGEYQGAKSVCETVDDGYKTERMSCMKKHLQKINLCEFNGFAIEGVVFSGRDNQKYKLTGTFGSVNQVVGLPRYGRGKIPRVQNSTLTETLLSNFSLG